ncbi:MAG: M15 family metallopeptidase, partial [Segetibacter sp.]
MFLFSTVFIVISFSHVAFSQDNKTVNSPFLPPVINNVKAYTNSILLDSSKRLVSLQRFIPQLVIDLKYATKNNFTHSVLYSESLAFSRLAAAIALKKINVDLNKIGLTLKIFDAYRPYAVTRKMWKL